jgi:hypothetical protein
MFGFGKKPLDERLIGGIAIETSMFMRWIEEKRRRMLSSDEVNDIVQRILEREKLKFTAEEKFLIVGSAITMENEPIDDFRKRSGFDNKVEGFCKSIGIPFPTNN